MDAKAGDLVQIITHANEIFEGILMPQEKKSVVIKLKSGYNIGIDREKVEQIKILKKSETEDKKTKEKKEIKSKKDLPLISILHTGGTIASRVDYRTGAVNAEFSPEELLTMFPELREIANFNSELISNMWSDDLRFKHFEIMAKAIEKQIERGAKGIIIGMGTDNLAVASAALSFILKDLPIPVLFIGAQRSSDRGSSDAAINLVCASLFIKKTDFTGVAICMHERMDDKTCDILPSTKTRKLHSSRRDAFKAVNDKPIARVDYDTQLVEFIKKDYKKRSKETKLEIMPNMEEKVGFLKIHINMFPEEFEFYKGYKGLIIEGTGLGHTPGHVPNKEAAIHKEIFPAIKSLVSSGCVVVMTTQCLFGRVNMNVYSKGTDLQDLGVISGEDMLPETAFVKLAWLLGNYPKEDAKKLMIKNLAGEISERTENYDIEK
jgi:glutamyl-tRNA(Gln) amidotransferase subunit D